MLRSHGAGQGPVNRRVRRVRKLISSIGLAFALISFSPATGIGSTGNAPTPGPKDVASTTGPIDPRMVAEQPLDEVASDIERLAINERVAGFTGLGLDLAHRSVQLYWHGTLDSRVSALI